MELEQDHTNDDIEYQMFGKTTLLADIEKIEEITWRQRSRIKWLHVGERNTMFFHSSTQVRAEKAFITELSTPGGSIITDQEDIRKHIVAYYTEKFTTHEVLHTPSLFANMINNVRTDENNQLADSLLQAEIKEAVFDVDGDRVQNSFWKLPMPNEVKLCCDGPSIGNPGTAGIGVVFQDSEGAVLGALSKAIGISTSFVAEILTIITWILKAVGRGWHNLWVISDSETTIITF
ncbi:hypothetical protein GIB67_021262 [Kingdonia uniflora]|uniref:RNase H type-1 domain-containing protein n=1 Tax=Kingdonia uniflora TaxID=39325 RepID=A0A7J7LFL3_9MAGN|nr:hypothetical protein GIB67_021262 [Kingdonia uniflora]